jgi:uncharacterized protein
MSTKLKSRADLLPASIFDKNGRIKNYVTARPVLLRFARLRNPFAQNLLGYALLEGKGGKKDRREARIWFERAAKAGFVEAIGNLALIHENGWGVKRNPVRAFQEYERASRRGDIWATTNLAFMYLAGDGTEKDPKQGIQLLKRSAAANDPKALYNLGLAYENGLGVVRSLRNARKYMRLAGEFGHRRARIWLTKQGVDEPQHFVKRDNYSET